ncbi:response regulator transcription factor [Algiphilus sp.]|uniref:response regulator transcription factor n=1 Tax=Algiphilus sp. TaxID=1872431 RepID=UPI003B527FDE
MSDQAADLQRSTVFIVDDESAVADSIALLLRSVGIQTQVFSSAAAFLDGYQPEAPGCLLLDVRMPRMSGLELQKEITSRGWSLPIIFITGHGDVPMAVEAMRAGATDFLQKPFNDNELIRRVQHALEQDLQDRAEQTQRRSILEQYGNLTTREREVAWMLHDGLANKAIALDLSLSERTVEQHRAQIMRKMQARSLAALVQMLTTIRQTQSARQN